MKVIMFQPRFAALVKAGTKTQTIRPVRKVPLVGGERVSLRQWSGLPYRSPQIELRTAEIVSVRSMSITITGNLPLEIEGRILWEKELDAFARADGFASAGEMVTWFDETHGLPFFGQLICWQ